MLSARQFQVVLISAVAFIALYFSSQVLIKLFNYYFLNAQAPAHVLQWEIEDVKGKFALKAVYSFETQKKIWKGAYRLGPPYYWNEPAAASALKGKAKEAWSAWYNPKNPAQSALEKAFPSGLCFRTLVCYALLIYFFLLRRRFIKIIIN